MVRNVTNSADSTAEEFQTSTGIDIWRKTVLQRMGFHGWIAACQPYITNTMPSVRWSGVKLTTTGLWSSSGYLFYGVTNNTSLSLGLVDARRTSPTWVHCANCNVWWRMADGMELFQPGLMTYTYLEALFSEAVFTYLTARFTAVSKRNV